MTDSKQSTPEVPSGIDPGVQSRIDALFARPLTVTSARHFDDPTKNNDTVVSNSDAATTTLKNTINLQPSKDMPSRIDEPSPLKKKPVENMEDDQDEGTWYEGAPWSAQPLPRPQAAGSFTDPSKTLQSPASPKQTTLPAFTPTHAAPILRLPPPSPPTLLSRALSYIGSYSISPAIIEYSDAEIRRKTEVIIKAQDWTLPSEKATDLVVRVVAILTDVSPPGVSEVLERPVEIQARHRRLREIKRERGCYVAEEVYGRQIRAALRRLKE